MNTNTIKNDFFTDSDPLAPRMGILGYAGEYRPRYGLWLNTSADCQQAVKGILADGFDCNVVLKYGARCPDHEDQPHRPIMPLSQYWKLQQAGALEDATGCYIREVFFAENLNLRKEPRR